MEGGVIHQWNVRVDVDVDVNNYCDSDGDGNIGDNGYSMGIVWQMIIICKRRLTSPLDFIYDGI